MTTEPEARVVLLVTRGLLSAHRREVVGEHVAAELPGLDVAVAEVDELPKEIES